MSNVEWNVQCTFAIRHYTLNILKEIFVMRAVQIVSPGQTTFVDAPKPALKPGYALVRTKLLSLCGSDVHMVYYDHPEEYPMKPGVTGHEMIGVIEAVDAPGSGLKVGDVALTLVPYQEAMAEYYLAPAEDVLLLPGGAR